MRDELSVAHPVSAPNMAFGVPELCLYDERPVEYIDKVGCFG